MPTQEVEYGSILCTVEPALGPVVARQWYNVKAEVIGNAPSYRLTVLNHAILILKSVLALWRLRVR